MPVDRATGVTSPRPRGRVCGVLGRPIAHSLSPVLHRAAYRELRLDWSYDAHDVGEDELAGFLAGLNGSWRGLSLTMPLKRRVLELCDEVEEVAAALGSVNTVVLGRGGERVGYNTDVGGFVDAFGEAGVTALSAVVIAGAGATAASALAAVARLGARQATVLARSLPRASSVAELGPVLGIDVRVLDMAGAWPGLHADALVSTIPLDGQAAVADRLAALASVVFDVVYSPRVTPLLERAGSRGATTVEGFSLLLHQAARQVTLMTRADPPPLEAMRTAGLAELGNRAADWGVGPV